MALEPYYKLTRAVAETLAGMYEVLFPEEYERLKPAFEAGKWIIQDAGPWIGRALVYKLDVELHLDENDAGPSVSFPCGDFTGGQMMVPQFEAKFRCVEQLVNDGRETSPPHTSYWPGHLCFFYSHSIFHRIAKWKPTRQGPNEATTPGRIGSVFFFPKPSFDILKDKPPGWGKRTGYGQWEGWVEA